MKEMIAACRRLLVYAAEWVGERTKPHIQKQMEGLAETVGDYRGRSVSEGFELFVRRHWNPYYVLPSRRRELAALQEDHLRNITERITGELAPASVEAQK